MKISAKEFESLFLQIRKNDSYWLSDSFDKNVGKILDTFFLDISDYAPDELFDSNDPNDINEKELYKRADNVLKMLKEIV
jgi:hypothetical protein